MATQPFLNWASNAERLSFDVPTLPLFVHERLSTKAIVETLVAHRKDKQTDMYGLFGDPRHSITDQVLRAYEYQDHWVNRLILGDSLVVMNSLFQYEGLGGQAQTIYIDRPYGVKFGSNFQPFVRERDVSHNDDEDLTREPEMVTAYRDTWELGLHSYLTYAGPTTADAGAAGPEWQRVSTDQRRESAPPSGADGRNLWFRSIRLPDLDEEDWWGHERNRPDGR